MKKIKLSYVIWAVIVAVIAILLIIRIDFSAQPAMAGPGAGSGNALPVRAVIATPAPLDDKIVSAGSLMPNEQVELVTEASGRIQNIGFTEGANVRKGEVLLQISNADLQAQLRRAQAQLKLMEDREGRQSQMLTRGGISQSEYDLAIAELHSAQADVQLLQAQIEKTVIRAPFSGTVGLRRVSQGSFVSSNTIVATLVSNNPIKIEFSVPERYSNEVNKGTAISFSIDGMNEDFVGRIYAIEPQIDQNTRTMLVKAKADNSNGKLMPGAFARVEVNLRRLEDAIMIPNEAVIPELGVRKVFVTNDGVVQSREVETGIRTADRIQVVSGLNPGDTVITTGLLQIRPGQAVRVTEIN